MNLARVRNPLLFSYPVTYSEALVVNNPVQQSVEQHALRMVNIEKYFGLVRALTNINLEVGRNEIVGSDR